MLENGRWKERGCLPKYKQLISFLGYYTDDFKFASIRTDLLNEENVYEKNEKELEEDNSKIFSNCDSIDMCANIQLFRNKGSRICDC